MTQTSSNAESSTHNNSIDVASNAFKERLVEEQPIEILDKPVQTIATPSLIQKALNETEVQIKKYDSFSVELFSRDSQKPQAISEEPENRKTTDREAHSLSHSLSHLSAHSSSHSLPLVLQRPQKVCESALDLVGKTPMVRLSRFAKKYGIKCDLLAKCEFLSVGGSMKDRIGKQMIEEAEAAGILQPGDSIVEATSGNTGIGLCLAAAIKGYRVLITLPEKMSQEKSNTMAALGAEIIRTPTAAPWHSLNSHIGLAVKLQKTIPHCHFLDQYSNPANPRAHYLTTAEEILYQCDGKVDVLIIPVGTGGLVTGIAKKIKEHLASCKIIGVDPRGSILALPDFLNDEKRNQSYLVEGIGYDFVPSTLHRDLVDEWVKTDDEESFRLARELVRLEGMLVGGSAGAAMVAVLKVARSLKENMRCVAILPDSARNYMTKYMDDYWMIDNGFYPLKTACKSYEGKTVADISILPAAVFHFNEDNHDEATIAKAIHFMKKNNCGELVVMPPNGNALNLITQQQLSSALLSGRYTKQDSIKNLLLKLRKASRSSPLLEIAHILQIHPCVAIVDDKDKLLGILRPIDILTEIS